MGKYIIKLGDYYLEWSTVVDAPVTYGMTLDEFKGYYEWEYGQQGMYTLPGRLERVEEKGTSCYDDSDVDATIIGNRAGPDETELTKDEIYRAYCLRQPVRGWIP